MAILNATDIVIKLKDGAGGTPSDKFLHATSASLTINRETRDATTKNSQGWEESLAGQKSWEISGDGFVDFTTTASHKNTSDLISQMLSSTPECEVSFGVTGGTIYTGTANITNISINAGVEESATYSISLKGTGELQ